MPGACTQRLRLLALVAGRRCRDARKRRRRPMADQCAPRRSIAAQIAKGAQLSAIGDCRVCHTADGGTSFAGGRALPTPFGTIYSTNITPDLETGIGRWTEDDFRRALHEGVDRAGRHLYPAFPYDHFTRVSDDDVDALYAFIMTREPVAARAPANRLVFPANVRPLLGLWKALYFEPGRFVGRSRARRRMESRRLSRRRPRALRRVPYAAQLRRRRKTGRERFGGRRRRALARTCAARRVTCTRAVDGRRACSIPPPRVRRPSWPCRRPDGAGRRRARERSGGRRARDRRPTSRAFPDRRATCAAMTSSRRRSARIRRRRAPRTRSRDRRQRPRGRGRGCGRDRLCRCLRHLPLRRRRRCRSASRSRSRLRPASTRQTRATLLHVVKTDCIRRRGRRRHHAGFRRRAHRRAAGGGRRFVRGRFSDGPQWTNVGETLAQDRAGAAAMIESQRQRRRCMRSTPMPTRRCSTCFAIISASTARSSAAASASAARAPSSSMDKAIFSCVTPISVLGGRAIRTVEGLGTAEQSGPAAARVHRRAGRAVRVLHRRNDHARAGTARRRIRRRPTPRFAGT